MITLTYLQALLLFLLAFTAFCSAFYHRLCNRELTKRLDYALNFIRKNYPATQDTAAKTESQPTLDS